MKNSSSLRWTEAVMALLTAVTLACGILFATGCGTAARKPHPFDGLPFSPGAANYSTNLLQQGDMVSVTFQYSSNFNTVQKIAMDGTINLESVGTTMAAGYTSMELQMRLAELYRPQIKDDVVTVRLVSAISSVYVTGAVFRPGKIAMERPLTVLEAVIEAGGYDPTRANLSKVNVLRIVNGIQETYPVNLKAIIEGKEPTPFYLRPFDVIYVPNKVFNF
ncbi:MAG: polysaccharide biosynthesis/export family protein [Verrucomicrobiota bacterium]|nr:polysaccharide biosynthesis/export family protein [Verrucomicrobiota bacterium]